MHENQATPKSPLPRYALQNAPKWFRLLPIFVLAAWVIGMVTDILLPQRYLPSHEWLKACEPYATLGGAAAALLCTFLMAIGLWQQEQVSGKRQNPVIKAGFLILGLFVFYFPLTDLLRRGVPAFVALAAGDRVEHAFIIAKADGTDRSHCRREVAIRDMPFMIRLCGMPESFRTQLSPGMPVTFSGKGTWMGLFVEDIRTP